VAIQAGDVVWTILGDVQPLNDALKASDKAIRNSTGAIMDHAKRVGVAMTAIGAGITAALGGAVKSWADAGDEIQKMSLRTGIGTEALSEYSHAAMLSGTSLEGMETGIRRMQRAITEAGDETAKGGETLGTYQEALAKLNLTYEDLAGLSVEQQFETIAYALADVEDATTKAAIAQEIFGRSGTQLLPMLAEGKAGLEAMRQEARDLGIVYDQEAANAAANFNDSLERLTAAFHGVIMVIGPVVADILDELVPALQNAITQFRDWIAAHPVLTEWLVKAAAAVGILFSTLGPFLIMLPGIVSLFSTLSTVLGFAGGAVGLTGALTGTGVAATAAGVGITGLVATLAGPAALIGALLIVVPLVVELVKGYVEWGKELQQLARSEVALQNTIERRIAQLEELGIAVDREAMREMDADQQIAYLDERARSRRDADLQHYLENIASKTEADAKFGLAKNLSLNQWITGEEAARAAISDADATLLQELLRADEKRTDELLRQIGVRTSATENSAENTERIYGQLGANLDKITDATRNSLDRLDLAHRESPSILDGIFSSLQSAQGMYQSFYQWIANWAINVSRTIASAFGAMGPMGAMGGMPMPAMAGGYGGFAQTALDYGGGAQTMRTGSAPAAASGVMISGNTFVIREEADINKIASELHRQIESASRGMGRQS